MFRTALVLWALLMPFNLFSQDRTTDSLFSTLKTAKDDTGKVNLLDDLSLRSYVRNPDTTILLAEQALDLSEKLGWKTGVALSFNRLGIGYQVKGDYSKALGYYLQSLKMYKEIAYKKGEANDLCNIGLVYHDQGDYIKGLDYYQNALIIFVEEGNKKGQAGVLGNIGSIYQEQADYTKALDYTLKALKIYEELGVKQGQATYLGNVGTLYQCQGDHLKALDYELKALKMYLELGDKQGQARNLGNIGNVYQDMGQETKAIDYEWRALKLNEELANKQGQANNLGNLGNIYKKSGDYDKALDYEQNALKIFVELGDKKGEAGILGNLGSIYLKSGNFKEAEINLKKAIVLDSTINGKNDLRIYEEVMSQLYDTTKRYQLALYWYKKSTVLKDTLFSIDENKALTRKELTFKFKHQQDSAKAEEISKDAIHNEQLKKQRIITWCVSGGLCLVLVFAFFVFRSLRTARKQKDIIVTQKAEVEKKNMLIEEKNKDILDSITYAKRLQDAILPPLSVVKKYLPDSFLLYKPKDIVAGDFYWMEELDDVLLIAACDCTGHGVPGAMVSVVCSNAINRALKEFRIRNTGSLLDKVRELVLETFEKSEGEVKDGMDCSFCAINTKTNQVEWSGAYNSLWYVENGELKEISANKQPIGKTDNPAPFTTHTLTLSSSKEGEKTILYLFTDGYADQFGGPKGKKFKYKQMQELLLANHNKPMEEQGRILNETFEVWKGNLEQVDDVLVIGIRV